MFISDFISYQSKIKQTQRAKIAVPASHFMNLWHSSQSSLKHKTTPIKIISSLAWFRLCQHPPAIFPLCILPQPTGHTNKCGEGKSTIVKATRGGGQRKGEGQIIWNVQRHFQHSHTEPFTPIKRYYPVPSDFDPVSYVMEMKMT